MLSHTLIKEYNIDDIMENSSSKAESFSQVYNLTKENELKERKRKKVKEKVVDNILSIPSIIESIGVISGGIRSDIETEDADQQAKFRTEGIYVNYKKQNDQLKNEMETLKTILNNIIEENK